MGLPVADSRRPGGGLSRRPFLSRGQGSRRPGGDGLDLLQAGRHPLAGGGHQVAGVGASIGSGAAVGREGPIIQIGAALGSASSQILNLSTTRRSRCFRRRGGGHRSDVQHADRGRPFRNRNPSAGGFKPYLSAGGHRDRRGDSARPHPDRAESRLHGARTPVSARSLVRGRGGAGLRRAGRSLRICRVGVHPAAGHHGRWLSEIPAEYLHPEHRGHGVHGRPDGGLRQCVRPLLCRRRRLWGDPGDSGSPDDRGRPSRPAVCGQAPGDRDQPGLRRFGRDLFPLAFPRGHARGGLRDRRRVHPSEFRPDPALGGHCRDGRRGRRRDRRRPDRDHHDFRDDPRLRDHRPGHHCGGGGFGRPPADDPGDDLHKSNCAIAGTASRRSGMSTSTWSDRRRT